MRAMSDRRQARATEGAAATPLSPEQRRTLALLARQAFGRLCAAGALGDAAEFDSWRHHQCVLAVERPGLRACRNEDYLPLRAHFLALLGRREAAERARVRAEVEPLTWAVRRLETEMAAARDVIERPEEYVASIARCKFKTRLFRTDLNEKQVWTLVFDIRRAAQKRRGVRRGTGDGQGRDGGFGETALPSADAQDGRDGSPSRPSGSKG